MHILQKKIVFSVFCFVLSSLFICIIFYTHPYTYICMHACKSTTITIHTHYQPGTEAKKNTNEIE